MTKNATYNVANNRETATIDASKVTGVLFENEYKVGPPSSRNASNQPFIMGVVVPWKLGKEENIKIVQLLIMKRFIFAMQCAHFGSALK